MDQKSLGRYDTLKKCRVGFGFILFDGGEFRGL
jgi:hypothetical protein